MTIALGRWTKLGLATVGMGLATMVLMGSGGCFILDWLNGDVDFGSSSYADTHYWVTCLDNHAVLMGTSNGSNSLISSMRNGDFKPADWDCSHPDDLAGAASCSANKSSAFPHYKGSGAAPYPSGAPKAQGQPPSPRATIAGAPYLRQQFQALPFLPVIPNPALAACDSSYPDVLQTVNTQAKVTRISTCPFKIVATIPVADRPLQVAITPDGATALVTSFTSAVSFIDLATNQVTYTLKTDPTINPSGIAILPDGSRAYITSFSVSTPVIQTIDMASKKIVGSLNVYQWPQGLTLTPDGSQLWITSTLSPTVAVVDTLTNTFVTGLAIPQSTDVAFNSTGTRAYVTSTPGLGPGNVVVVDTQTYQILKTYKVGQNPADIAMTYGGKYLIVNNDDDGSISTIDLVKDKVTTTVVGAHPSGITFVH